VLLLLLYLPLVGVGEGGSVRVCDGDGKPGVNFTNVLLEAFTRIDPKSAQMTVKPLAILRFWNLHALKLPVNMLVKLTPEEGTRKEAHFNKKHFFLLPSLF